MIEFLIVLALLGIVTASAVPSLLLVADGPKLEQSVRFTVSALREARALALAGRAASVQVNPRDRTITAADGTVHRVSRGTAVSITALRNQAGGNSAAIAFFPDGSSSGGRVLLARDGSGREILVNWATGAATARTAR